MDPKRFKEAYQRLDLMDERLRHKITPRASLHTNTLERVDERLKDLSTYTVELKEIVAELFMAIAGKSGGGGPGSKSP